MRIEFDTGNHSELAAVAALIASLRGESLQGGARVGSLENTTFTVNAADFRIVPTSEPDPAEAFAGGASAEQAFGGDSPLPPAVPATSPTSAPTGEAATGAAPAAGPPATPTASPTNAPAGVDVDSTGLPHDGRIHSTPASKTADGKWRKKRGVDAATTEAVTAQLRQAMAAPAVPVAQGGAPATGFSEALEQSRAHLGGDAPNGPAPTPPAPPVATAPAAPAAESASSAPPAPPAAPAAPPAPPAPAPAAPAAAMTFADLMRKITQLQTAGQLTVETTAETAKALGLTGVRDLINRPDLVPAFDQLLPVVG